MKLVFLAAVRYAPRGAPVVLIDIQPDWKNSIACSAAV
jgi:hypothetical protein